jgi:hypothetical protein
MGHPYDCGWFFVVLPTATWNQIMCIEQTIK